MTPHAIRRFVLGLPRRDALSMLELLLRRTLGIIICRSFVQQLLPDCLIIQSYRSVFETNLIYMVLSVVYNLYITQIVSVFLTNTFRWIF